MYFSKYFRMDFLLSFLWWNILTKSTIQNRNFHPKNTTPLTTLYFPLMNPKWMFTFQKYTNTTFVRTVNCTLHGRFSLQVRKHEGCLFLPPKTEQTILTNQIFIQPTITLQRSESTGSINPASVTCSRSTGQREFITRNLERCRQQQQWASVVKKSLCVCATFSLACWLCQERPWRGTDSFQCNS